MADGPGCRKPRPQRRNAREPMEQCRRDQDHRGLEQRLRRSFQPDLHSRALQLCRRDTPRGRDRQIPHELEHERQRHEAPSLQRAEQEYRHS
ncbi:hypothetical protein [Mumia zhuanghuii]|uniref:Uncharacterized protein n=1 Tax=Mumia zhuanghuii TaxID=2585211 RepID=A0A5C4MGL8_9ACTN|nr:hypothetical protein [Mumia zhuanghuii]TNC35596.1 hypothetical protein FHE65_26985 [Mumia zhuanghuii]